MAGRAEEEERKKSAGTCTREASIANAAAQNLNLLSLLTVYVSANLFPPCCLFHHSTRTPPLYPTSFHIV